MDPEKRPQISSDPASAGPESDGRTVDDDVLRTIVAEWGEVCANGAEQTVTLKVDGLEVDTPVTDYVIKERTLNDGSGPATAAAEYELIEILGQGGMGVVYDARQTSMDRAVAVKVLRPDKSETDRVKFLTEAAVTADLDHPNIVPIYDLGSHGDGALFYSMKRVRGTPWEERIDQLSRDENLAILSRVGEAITFAHARGFIHRDLKPSNVMLGDYGEVLVMDWGLAISVDANARWRVAKRAPRAGTPAYMAPEMATGDVSRLGIASDIYLLGGILFRILTGTPPHRSDTILNCVAAAARNEIVETDQQGELMEVAMRALATEPADRFPTVACFQQAIRDYQDHFESIQLTERAARELADAGSTGVYRTFGKAVFRLEEACELWPGNEKAHIGLAQAKLTYAQTAMQKGDLDLAGSLLIEETPWPAESLEQRNVVKAQLFARRARKRTQRLLLALLCGAVGVLLIVGMSITLWLRSNAMGLARQQGPIAQHSSRSLVNIQRSQAALRGWVDFQEESFKTERRQAWEDEIVPAVAQLEQLSNEFSVGKRQSRMTELRQTLDKLRDVQISIENLPPTTGNDPDGTRKRMITDAVTLSARAELLLTEIAEENSEMMRAQFADTLSGISAIALAVTILLAVMAFLVGWNFMREGFQSNSTGFS